MAPSGIQVQSGAWIADFPVANEISWWLTSDRVGNYQGGGRDTGPGMSRLCVR